MSWAGPAYKTVVLTFRREQSMLTGSGRWLLITAENLIVSIIVQHYKYEGEIWRILETPEVIFAAMGLNWRA